MMGFDESSAQTPLILALRRGMEDGASLSEELWKLGDLPVKSHIDAEAICHVLERLADFRPNDVNKSALSSLVRLFELVESTECPAFAILATRGVEILLKIVDEGLCTPPRHEADDVLFTLDVLAMYGTRAGTDAVIRAARMPLAPESSTWSVIFSRYECDHPDRERLFSELSDPLPTDFVAVALLDSANCAHRQGSGGGHSFDSPVGIQQLEDWLIDQEHVSYAQSAARALPYLRSSGRDALLALALDHSDINVQIEGALAAAKLGRDAGIDWLTRCCRDVRHSVRAQLYLRELERDESIPSECLSPDFQAMAEFAHWLSHPNELGSPPDELEIVDHRTLAWPPEREVREVWLIKFRMHDAAAFQGYDVGVGMVGSVTFCLFSYDLANRPPEDAYAVHCYWEMRNGGLISEVSVPEHSEEFDELFRQCKSCDYGQATITLVTEFSQELGYPQRLIALATAACRGVPGWLVVDGPRSQWYCPDESPNEDSGHSCLVLHIGRVLLRIGTSDNVDS